MGLERTTGSTLPKWQIALRWLLLLGWMALIYRLSDTPDLRTVPWAQRFHLLPAMIGPEMTHLLEMVLRKSAHVAAFGILAWLAYLAFAGTFTHWSRGRLLAVSFVFTVLYAASDEWHQTFVPDRTGSTRDVAIDTAGATIALALIYLRNRRGLPSSR